METWVEKGRAPDVMIGAHVDVRNRAEASSLQFPLDRATPISFTRPIYPYPTLSRYKGVDDPNEAANWRPRDSR